MNGDVDAAVALYERALATRHAAADAYNDYGVLLLARGDSTAATEMFRQALNRNERSLEAWVNLGDAFASTGRLTDAVAAYVRADRLDGSRLAIKSRLARSFELLGDTIRARRVLDEVRQLDTLRRTP